MRSAAIVLRSLLCLILVFAGALSALPTEAQVVPAAFRGPDTLWAGAEFSLYNPSFPYQSSKKIQGVAAFADFNLYEHFGLEANARFLSLGGFHGETEQSYLAGPRYRMHSWGKLQPWAQTLTGVATIHYPFSIGTANYFAIAPAVGVNYRLRSHWLVRAAFEEQLWLNSPGYANMPDHPLRPSGVSIGMAYRLLR